MPKLVTAPESAPAPTCLDLARANLDELHRRAAELDGQGAGLVAEFDRVDGRIPEAALDAIEDPAKADVLAALRARKAAIPGEIETLKAARNALDAEITEGQALVRHAETMEAAVAAVELTAERERLAAEIDAALVTLGAAWGAYTAGGEKLRRAFETLGVEPRLIAKYDHVGLKSAVRAVSHDLALAIGQPKPTRLCVGTLKHEDDFRQWQNSASMVEADDSERARELLAAAAGVGRAA